MTLERLGRQSRKSEKTPVTSLEVNRLKVTNPGKISKEFNNHFSTTGSKLDSEINADGGDYERYLTCTDTRFHLHPTKQTVFLLKNKLNKSNTTGLKKYLRDLFGSARTSFVGLYAIFLTILSDRVNSKKTGDLLESRSSSSKVIEMT